MASGNCPTCNNLVDKSAKFCPQCGRTDFRIKTEHKILKYCTARTDFEKCQGGLYSIYNHYGNKRTTYRECDRCGGRGVISEDYVIDVREGLSSYEIKKSVEAHNRKILESAREERRNANSEKSQLEEERNIEHQRIQSGRCLKCGKKVWIFGMYCRKCSR